jgi:hypothetical protein
MPPKYSPEAEVVGCRAALRSANVSRESMMRGKGPLASLSHTADRTVKQSAAFNTDASVRELEGRKNILDLL